jgi:Domain of unknown function (DUF4193)
MATASDYEVRRRYGAGTEGGTALGEIESTLPRTSTAVVDDDPNDVTFFELPGADLSGEELSVTVIPQRADEFTCSSCFLVQHRSRLRKSSSGLPICADCA